MSLTTLSKLSRLCSGFNGISTKIAKEFQVTPFIVQRATLNTSCAQCQQNKTSTFSRIAQRNLPSTWIAPLQSSQFTTVARDEGGVLSRMWKGLGFSGKLRYKKYILQASGLRLYLCCVELVDYTPFFEEFDLPDTFNSWFRITELHIWMCMVRLAQEQNEGKFVRNSAIRYMWQDVDKKSKKLGDLALSAHRRQGIQILSEQFKSALFAYDEGLLDDDKVLAGALWRHLLDMKCDDPEKLELLVSYVRKQICHLDQQESGVVLTSGLVQFLPLKGEEDKHRNKQILQEILRRV